MARILSFHKLVNLNSLYFARCSSNWENIATCIITSG